MYQFTRRYMGPLQAVIMDWAGTTVDFGSMAPIHAFCRLFEQNKTPITVAEARAPMGAEKREHIRQLCEMPRVREAWFTAHGAEPTTADIDRMYEEFVPLQIAAIAQCGQLIPGLKETLAWCREQEIAIGANTGYAERMIEGLLASASEQGYKPDSNVCATDVPKGRPYPHMALKNAIELEVSDVAACVKIDDTLTGIDEGLSAGMWTIGVAVSGNEVGLTLDEWQALPEEEQQIRRRSAYQRFYQAGAHYVVDSIADAVPCLMEIQERLAAGDAP
ncbi:phosphonoacetaldehyde hydrolase [Oceanospirillum linum]|uniref:Phosphonoacetaldehyde hydrolase n=1 Tax=Oceanospirillum linum TaxID=966 RepID=A0A1T1H9W2_OCELI|nr:phosphonoacetaldehyde hydrolase [Oceanospirillum linum]OOV86623.1 phosphonoacetaldehyde hydrolase [Oceanospirillum linum]SEG28037.1 phosphonoacetaldehyde hydrolase [Oleiphilus messinensis]SMP27187.1 phosphonoacetaldehyde hydrolase [Oceanospirillum linum]